MSTENLDAFGGETVPTEAPVENTEQKPDEKGDNANKGVDNKNDKGGDDIENHPKFKEMQSKLDSLGGNLSGQNKIINTLKSELEKAKKGGANPDNTTEGVLFKEVKTSKDLSQEEKDEMTDTELKQFDEIATLKKGMNDLAKMIAGGKKSDDGVGEGDGEGEDGLFIGDNTPVVDFKGEVKAIALKLAGDDVDMANNIIAEFNQFADNDKLNKQQLSERLLKSAKLVDGFKPMKEQSKKIGKTVGSDGTKEDPFGNNAIVEGVRKNQNGNYSL